MSFHELESGSRIHLLSQPDQAFSRISRTIQSSPSSRRSRPDSSRSLDPRLWLRPPSSRSAYATQVRIAPPDGSNSLASFSSVRFGRTNSAIWRLNSGGYATWYPRIMDSCFLPDSELSAKAGQLHRLREKREADLLTHSPFLGRK